MPDTIAPYRADEVGTTPWCSRHARAHALREQAGLDRRADAADAEIGRLEAGLIPGRTTAFVDERRAQATRHRELAREARAELAQVGKDLARLEREEAAVYERMLEPQQS